MTEELLLGVTALLRPVDTEERSLEVETRVREVLEMLLRPVEVPSEETTLLRSADELILLLRPADERLVLIPAASRPLKEVVRPAELRPMDSSREERTPELLPPFA